MKDTGRLPNGGKSAKSVAYPAPVCHQTCKCILVESASTGGYPLHSLHQPAQRVDFFLSISISTRHYLHRIHCQPLKLGGPNDIYRYSASLSVPCLPLLVDSRTLYSIDQDLAGRASAHLLHFIAINNTTSPRTAVLCRGNGGVVRPVIYITRAFS